MSRSARPMTPMSAIRQSGPQQQSRGADPRPQQFHVVRHEPGSQRRQDHHRRCPGAAALRPRPSASRPYLCLLPRPSQLLLSDLRCRRSPNLFPRLFACHARSHFPTRPHFIDGSSSPASLWWELSCWYWWISTRPASASGWMQIVDRSRSHHVQRPKSTGRSSGSTNSSPVRIREPCRQKPAWSAPSAPARSPNAQCATFLLRARVRSEPLPFAALLDLEVDLLIELVLCKDLFDRLNDTRMRPFSQTVEIDDIILGRASDARSDGIDHGRQSQIIVESTGDRPLDPVTVIKVGLTQPTNTSSP